MEMFDPFGNPGKAVLGLGCSAPFDPSRLKRSAMYSIPDYNAALQKLGQDMVSDIQRIGLRIPQPAKVCFVWVGIQL